MLSLKPGLVGSHFKLFGSCDLDLDLMTFIYELDLSFLKIYLQTKHELFRSELTKLLKKNYRITNIHTYRSSQKHYCAALWVVLVIICTFLSDHRGKQDHLLISGCGIPAP